ncbi:MAG: GTP cyclohydrolase II, partial [Sphingomonas sp.]
MSAVRAAIALLRTGRPVRITGSATITVVAVETVVQELLDVVDPEHEARLMISGERAAALHLANERDAADPSAPVLIAPAPWLDARSALAIADPGNDLDRSPIGPLQPLATECVE